MVTKTYLEHLVNVVVFGLQQLAPGGQVAVGEDAAGLQHPVSVTLQTKTDTTSNPFTVRTRPEEDKQATVCAPNEAQCMTTANVFTLESLLLFTVIQYL